MMIGLFTTLSAFASLSGLYVMQSVWKDDTVTRDAPPIRWSYRLAMLGMSLGFLWCAANTYDSNTLPSAPDVVMVVFWNIIMVTRAVSIGIRRYRWGHSHLSTWAARR
jgi:hypothetical protein